MAADTAISKQPPRHRGGYVHGPDASAKAERSSPITGERNLGGFTRLANALEDIVHETQPDAVVSTYPVYGHVIRELYRDHAERPFRFITVITDSISVNSAWYRAPSDFFCVPNEATAEVFAGTVCPSRRLKPWVFPPTWRSPTRRQPR